MERKLASVQKVIQLRPIDGADKIEVAVVLGWECIVLKSENYKVGDLVCYIEIDSQVPIKPEFEFLRDRKFRIRTIKLRKQISQGLIIPLSILPKGKYSEGQDVTEIIGVKKYDPQAEQERQLLDESKKNPIHKFFMRYDWYRKLSSNSNKSKFPSFIRKTDEDRIQLFPYLPETQKDTVFTVTEKLDGQSGTYFLKRNKKRWFWQSGFEFGVCSRNLQLQNPDNSSYWTIAKQCFIKDSLEILIGGEDYVVLQGEIIGNGIQKNKYKIEGYEFFAFNLIYPSHQLESVEAKEILSYQGIKFVPILDTNFKLFPTIAENVDYAKGKSQFNTTLREGIVIRNKEKNLSYKIINPEFLLKNDE